MTRFTYLAVAFFLNQKSRASIFTSSDLALPFQRPIMRAERSYRLCRCCPAGCGVSMVPPFFTPFVPRQNVPPNADELWHTEYRCSFNVE